MKIIKDSPEHHFLTFMDKLRRDPAGWMGLRIALSHRTAHADVIEVPEQIAGKLRKTRLESDEAVAGLKDSLEAFGETVIYQFADSDIAAAVRVQNNAEHDSLQALFRKIVEKYGAPFCELSNLAKEVYSWQKLADEKLLSLRRIEAYEALADFNRVQSIPLRRMRREDPVILIVEDDRFTASYASGFLSKDYEAVVAKTGEDAILAYIEHAPDAVFLDIHLPGLSGHDTLRAFRRADPDAFVVMLSVDTVKETIVETSRHGASGFLKKPFSRERLLAAVEKSPFVKKGGGR